MRRIVAALAATVSSLVTAAPVHAQRLTIPPRTRQLVVVSAANSPGSPAPGGERLATLRAYARAPGGRRWRPVFGPWEVETGSGGLVAAARRREGDRATPVGVFGFGHTIYGLEPDPGGLHYRYHRLLCGDWWDEDPSSALYNRLVHVPCGDSPAFGGNSEALWTETLASRYFVPIDFNLGPIRRGPGAPGSGIFLHSWTGAATAGCVALPTARLLRLLRWLRPSQQPAIAIGSGRVLDRRAAAPGGAR
jgi:L,D-peptidoglycan transpeptidase YkuD (ErfK/YbiS/YcfS/YnhG family)